MDGKRNELDALTERFIHQKQRKAIDPPQKISLGGMDWHPPPGEYVNWIDWDAITIYMGLHRPERDLASNPHLTSEEVKKLEEALTIKGWKPKARVIPFTPRDKGKD
jgi:hypothetical protein